jgi:hypothetical protein
MLNSASLQIYLWPKSSAFTDLMSLEKTKTKVESHPENSSWSAAENSHRGLHLFICIRFRLPRVCHADSLIWHLGRGFSSKDISKQTGEKYNSENSASLDVSQTIAMAFSGSEELVSMETLSFHAPVTLDFRWKYFHDCSSTFKSSFKREKFSVNFSGKTRWSQRKCTIVVRIKAKHFPLSLLRERKN